MTRFHADELSKLDGSLHQPWNISRPEGNHSLQFSWENQSLTSPEATAAAISFPLSQKQNSQRQNLSLRHIINRVVLVSLVLIPFAGMGFLTLTVLAPSLKNPEAKFYGSSKGYPAKQRAAGEAIAVSTVAVGEAEFTQSLSAPGESVALQSIEIRSEIEGIVESVFVEEGDWVQAGQPLVQLDRKSFLDEVNIAENNVANDQTNLQSAIESAANDALKLRTDVLKAEERVATAQTRLDVAQDVIQERRQNAIDSAQIQLDNAIERLEQIKTLVEEGALSQFELLQAEDEFAKRQHELFLIQQGSLDDNAREYNDRDYLISRQLQLDRSKIALERSLTLEPGRIEKAQLRLETRQAQLREAYRNLERTTITAPTDGLISVLTTDSGEVVSSGSGKPLMLLNENVLFEVFIDQAQLNQVAEGDGATVRLTAYPGQLFTGEVVRVNPTIETDATEQNKVGTDRQYTYSVWVQIDDLQMPPGLQGYVQFGKAKTALSIPESSFVHLSGGEGMVMAMVDGVATPRAVQVGPLLDNQREVMAGLEPGDRVILNPHALEPGDRVIEAALEPES